MEKYHINNSAPGWGTQDLRHLSPETFAEIGMPNIVYVREVLAGELESELGSEINVPADTKLFAVHAANGQRMAVLDDRDTAFAGARQYELEPVSVH
ncbi:MAG: DUF1150 domain-containing protein [Parvibaculum sp.]